MCAHLPSSTGKTPHALIKDAVRHDPRHKLKSGFNVLADIPEWSPEDGFKIGIDQARGTCPHDWCLDELHSELPERGEPPEKDSLFCVTAHCSGCRSHLVVMFDYRHVGHPIEVFLPCPTPEAPMHHFVHQPGKSQDFPHRSNEHIERQAFRCSSETCGADLAFTFRPARLPDPFIKLMTDKDVLTARAQKAIESDPERFEGHAAPSVADILTNLRAYIQNGMLSDQRRKILGQNKKFMLCFGIDCDELLKFIGFTKEVRLNVKQPIGKRSR